MGVKTTEDVRRQYAILRIRDFLGGADVILMKNDDLALILELINDAQNQGEGFVNYRVTK